jgi:uncharacterized protein YcfJ
MKKVITLAALLGLTSWAMAQETARVISSTPIIAQVAVPQKVCTQQQVEVKEKHGSAAGLAGLLIGGAIGNRFGSGDGRALATMAGAVGGAMIGDQMDNKGQSTRLETVQSCQVQNFIENRTTGYNVVYEFAGRQYTTQMATDPGPTLKIQVTPIATAPVTIVPVTQTPVVYYQRPAVPVEVVYVQTRPVHPHVHRGWHREYY